ncbi:MAG: hypothetical protein M3362_01895 [Acidobacteriota bacterium]|nr:hypothetical protein [Acidobacteriota bacterium]
MLEPLSIILSGLGLMQNAGSSKVQKQMAETLEHIRDILKGQSASKDSLPSFVPEPLWLTWRDAIKSHTITLVTGCHENCEIFDRPTAYSLKFAIDQFGQSYNRMPLHSMVIGDIWFYREPGLSHRQLVLSVGGPSINDVSKEICSRGSVIHSGGKWAIAKDNKRYAIYGDDPVDTLSAMRAFAEHELMPYLNLAWGVRAQ